ncbi:hypothetical protein CRE_04230 [Caenorhabditis remanei]|uniref:Lin-15A/B-like domain-containing protein n=1 Tax=Caenorhabditis remanei TaxID=31234 RepID=E3MYV2_CAERE|nr:hypothetical protein CRE_04230 [Caenorhabditis remanei]
MESYPEPKLEPVENVTVKIEPLEHPIPLQEPKLEPPDEMEWTQPKIEPVDDFETNYQPPNEYQEILEYHFEQKPGIIDESQPSTSLQDCKTEFGHVHHLVRSETKICTLCSATQQRDKMRAVTSKMQRTILIVARLLQSLITMKEAKEMMSETHNVVCESHFEESVGIFDVSYGKKELRSLVKELRPGIKFGDFIQAIQRFQGKQGEKMQHVAKIKPVSIPSKTTHKSPQKTEGHCSLCSKCQPLSIMSKIPNVDHILVIIIGSILRQTYTIGQAQIFLQLVDTCYICHEHFSSACQEICKFLGIEDLRLVSTCEMDRLVELMQSVNRVFPSYSDAKVEEIVISFYETYKKVIEATPGPPATVPANPTPAIAKKPPNAHYLQCALCSEPKSRSEQKKVFGGDRLVIIVGHVLLGIYSIPQIKEMVEEKKEIIVCHSHFSDALKGILETLAVDSVENIWKSPMSRIRCMMETVTALSHLSQASHLYFITFLEKFKLKYSDILSK